MSSLRLALLITALTAACAWLVQQVELVYAGPYLAGEPTSAAQVFAALPLAVLAAAGLARRWLPRSDRAVLYAALALGVSAVGSAFAHRFLPGLVTVFYGGFASPTGPYYRFLNLVPSWMVPGGPGSAPAVGAFEGGGAVPWGDWWLPLVAWTVLFALFFLTSMCLVWVFRERWMDTERLGFPLLEVPLGLLGDELLRRRSFWWGALVPVVLFGVNGLHHYFPAVAEIKASLDFAQFLLDDPWRAMAPFETPFVFEFSPLLIGVAFLAPVEVSFSTWFFFLVSRLQLLLTQLAGRMEYRGEFIPGHGSPWLDWPSHFPFCMAQARGGLLFLAGFSLWAARRSLRSMFSLRQPAVWGLLAGLAGMWLWVGLAGVPAAMGFLGLVLYLLLALAFVRLRIDGGLPVTQVYQIIGYLFFVALGTGPGLFADSTYVGLGFLAVMGFTAIGIWPAMQFEGLKLAEHCGVTPRRMIWGMALGLLVGLVAGYVFSLETMYHHGIFALQEQGGARSEARIGRYYGYLIRDAGTVRGDTDWVRLGFHLVGAGVTWALAAMRQHFLRWPLHPMGYIWGIGFGWMMWGAALTGWLCKWLTVRYGGAATYRRARPLFLGLIMGEIAMRVLWAVVALWHGQIGMGYRI